VVASAQKVTITVKCEPPAEAKVPATKDAKPKVSDKTARKFILPAPVTKTGSANLSPESQAGVITKNCEALARIDVGPSPTHANQTVLFNIAQSNNILGLKWNAGDQYGTTLQAFIQLNSSGSGSSPLFYVRGNELGTTILTAESPGFDDASLEIHVVECNCPIIPVSSPTRN
jgi:hypothetical protein